MAHIDETEETNGSFPNVIGVSFACYGLAFVTSKFLNWLEVLPEWANALPTTLFFAIFLVQHSRWTSQVESQLRRLREPKTDGCGLTSLEQHLLGLRTEPFYLEGLTDNYGFLVKPLYWIKFGMTLDEVLRDTPARLKTQALAGKLTYSTTLSWLQTEWYLNINFFSGRVHEITLVPSAKSPELSESVTALMSKLLGKPEPFDVQNMREHLISTGIAAESVAPTLACMESITRWSLMTFRLRIQATWTKPGFLELRVNPGQKR